MTMMMVNDDDGHDNGDDGHDSDDDDGMQYRGG